MLLQPNHEMVTHSCNRLKLPHLERMGLAIWHGSMDVMAWQFILGLVVAPCKGKPSPGDFEHILFVFSEKEY